MNKHLQFEEAAWKEIYSMFVEQRRRCFEGFYFIRFRC